MQQLLWTFDDVVQFIHHRDVPVRCWAFERLTRCFPDRAGEALTEMLDDANSHIACAAARFLSSTGDKQKYGLVLLEHLERTKGARFGCLAEALADLGYREALPLVLHRLKAILNGSEQPDSDELDGIIGALGTFGGDEARQMLWSAIGHYAADDCWAGDVMRALLNAVRPEDVVRLVQLYRSSLPSKHGSSRLNAFAFAIGAGDLAEGTGGRIAPCVLS